MHLVAAILNLWTLFSMTMTTMKNNYEDNNYEDDDPPSGGAGTKLHVEDVKHCQEDNIARVTSVLSISRVEATILVHHYGWSVRDVHEEWFANEHEVRKSVGLLDKYVDDIENPISIKTLVTYATIACLAS